MEQFLEPIKGDNPCGVDLRKLDASHQAAIKYFSLKDARNTQRRQERKNIEVEHILEISAREWIEVAELAQDLLLNHTKDLEVASWLFEALVRIEKFEGLCKGLRIFTGLVRKYANKLHPTAEEEEEQDIRLASVGMLGGKHEIGTIVVPLYYHALLPTTSEEGLNAWSIRQIIEKSGGNPDDVRKENLLERSDIRSAIAQLAKDEFFAIEASLSSAKTLFVEFNSALSDVFSAYAPDLTGLKTTLHYCCSIVASTKEILESYSAPSAAAEEVQQEEEQAPIQDTRQLDKEKAIKLLESVAQFFSATEKHSPISYSLMRIIRWAKAELPDVLSETMDDQAREMYCKVTGVPFSQDEKRPYAQEDY
jgi:type VI secretion system protein ImpA